MARLEEMLGLPSTAKVEARLDRLVPPPRTRAIRYAIAFLLGGVYSLGAIAILFGQSSFWQSAGEAIFSLANLLMLPSGVIQGWTMLKYGSSKTFRYLVLEALFVIVGASGLGFARYEWLAGIAFYVLAEFILAYLIWEVGRHWRAWPRGAVCPNCRYSLVGVTERRCPECGREFTLDELGISASDLKPPDVAEREP